MGAFNLTNPGLAYEDPGVTISPVTGLPMVAAPKLKYFKNDALRGHELAADAAAQAAPSTSSLTGPVDAPQATQTDASPPVMPKMFKPTFAQTVQPNAAGQPQPINPGQTKLGKLAAILGAAAQGAMAGYGQMNPAAGAQAARDIPYQQAERRQQMAQQQAQTALTQSQTAMVQTPMGPMTPAMAKAVYPALIKAGSATTVQGMKGDTAESVANTAAQSKKDVANINKRFTSVPGVGLLDTQSPNGPILVPGSEQGITLNQQHLDDYGLPKEFLGQHMTLQQLSQIEKAQAMRAGKTTNTVDFQKDENGNILGIPKTSVTTPNLPGGGRPSGAAAPSGGGIPTPRASAGAGTPRIIAKATVPAMVTGSMPDGSQVAGTPEELRTAGATGITKLEASDASKVSIARQMTSPGGLFNLAEKDLARFKPGELEALAPRWNEFLAGKIGTADPRYIALRTHVNGLLSTALMQAHVGARGGERIMEHFEDIANAGKMSKDTLTAALNAEKEYVQEKAMRPPKQQQGDSPTNISANAPPTKGFTRIQASDGALHDIPTAKLKDAQALDPGLKVQ